MNPGSERAARSTGEATGAGQVETRFIPHQIPLTGWVRAIWNKAGHSETANGFHASMDMHAMMHATTGPSSLAIGVLPGHWSALYITTQPWKCRTVLKVEPE